MRGQLSTDPQGEEKAGDELAEALAAMGLRYEGDVPLVEQDEFWLWPENEEAFGLWGVLQTQWNVSMGGPVGLNYGGVESYLRLSGIPKKKHRQLFISIQVMEHAALEEWASQKR